MRNSEPPPSVPRLGALPPPPAPRDPNALLVDALKRLTAGALVLAFGSGDAKRNVERLIDGELPEDEAEEVRAGLDAVTRRLLGH